MRHPILFKRRGIAFLMVVLMLLTVVVGGMQMMVRSEISDQSAAASRSRVTMMQRAIETVSSAGGDTATLPVSGGVTIVVTRDTEAESWTAAWMLGDRQLDSIVRRDTIRTQTNPPQE